MVNNKWGGKSYYTLNSFLREKFNEKVFKISLDGGFSCPNRDGTVAKGGCTYCSASGSGDFAGNRVQSISDQFDDIKDMMNKKWSNGKLIAYFQAYTNTYAPINYLRKVFYEAVKSADVEIISIATRPDCLGPEVLDLIAEINRIKPVWIELGLQTIHDKTARLIKRGYKLKVFEQAVKDLNEIGVNIIVHLILGLPGENENDMLETINYIAKQNIHGVKLQLLHILKNTALVNLMPSMHILTMDEYTDLVIKCIERLPQEVVIHRLTGDGPRGTLLAPLWSKDKLTVMNTINHKMKELDTWQGKFCD